MRDESERLSSEIRTHVPDKVTKPNPTVFGVTCRSALVSHVARRGRSTVANTTLNIKITTPTAGGERKHLKNKISKKEEQDNGME